MCVKPIIIKNKTNTMGGKNQYTTPVPCGQCPLCRKAKINSWLFRLDKELERSINPLFVTLTYNDTNLLFNNSGIATLHKKDLQDFFKRLRKDQEKNHPNSPKIKYYAVGEYGKLRNRPHYHIILYNLVSVSSIHRAWGKGRDLSLPLISGGTTYVLKYMSKPKTKINKYELQPEFSLMSKKMGENYLTPSMIKYHQSSPINSHVTTKQGFKLPLPKYYKEKIFDETQRKKVTEYLQNRSQESERKQLDKYRKRYPNKDENFYQNLLEQSKNLLKFEKRKNEVL